MKYIIVAIVLIVSTQASMTLQFARDPDALCLDGSPSSYYFERGSGDGADKWVVYFQGGGWIGGRDVSSTLNNAYSRSQTNLGSSNGLPEVLSISGMFIRNVNTNPELYNWNYIFINYCDGTGFQGHSTEPYDVNGFKIYFRGEKIVKDILDTYITELKAASQVLVSGCSAGGLAAYTWTEYVRELLPISVQVISAPDSGIFLDFPTYDQSLDYKSTYQLNFMELANKEVDPPNQKCVKANQNNKWKCLFAQYLIEYTSTPLFIVQSPYDSWCIPNVLKLSCANDGTLTKCDESQRSFIESQSSAMKIIMNGRMSTYNNAGAFAPACLQHCFLQTTYFNSITFKIPGETGKTLSEAISPWIANPEGSYDFIDQVLWPENKRCSKLSLGEVEI